ncbi:hypothetical protein [Qaidamihabitans albus]|uniref:hypothetical protein n=1 Tax=Qaidamihabitans albus TaxID=2795733 RepID=UPI0018F2531B|nr:hypothetical protein [Qaidamihabitans albus]
MATDNTFRYGGAAISALVMGWGVGFAVEPVAGLIAGLAAGLAWLAAGMLARRR